ncbi:hypothetical protein [Mesorhizobium sp. Z1-4]|uniref:hypothetical protein n=1 Tax=Mesorhizobium sp. Z1-4 TaxID=2448478 RepID=UPI000FD8D47B|nr:hypothetical protein [Mesorhizobium sp. Z1-4]
MDQNEALAMMRRCREEIVSLRRANAELAPKAQAYDDMSKLIRVAIPERAVGMGEDLAWTLDKRIREVEAELEASKSNED